MNNEFINIYNNLIKLTRNKDLFYINVLYSIIDKIHKWDHISDKEKKEILEFYINLKGNSDKLVKYFNNYEKYLIKTSLNLFTKSVINHRF